MRRLFALILIGCGGSSEEATPVADSGVAEDAVVDVPAKECTPERTADDRPDDVDGYMIRLWYVLPSDGKDEENDKNGKVERAALAFNEWLRKQSGGTKLRFDTCGGKLDIGFKRLAKNDASIQATGALVLDEIAAEMPPREKKIHAVYYGGGSTYSCGGAQLPPARVGNTAAMYLKGTPPGPRTCDVHSLGREDIPLGYMEIGLLHEIFHTLGAAAKCAPNFASEGHISGDSRDLMYRGSESWQANASTLLDIGRDDYWGHGKPCLDVSKSVFLDPLPEGAVPPPGW